MLLCGAVAAGSHALNVRWVEYHPRDIHADGRMIVYRVIQTSQHLEMKPFIFDVEWGTIQHDISEFSSVRPHWKWAADQQSLIGAVPSDDPDVARVVQLDVDGTPRVMSEKRVGSNELEFVGVRSDGSLCYVEDCEGHVETTLGGKRVVSRPCLRIATDDGAEIARLEYGMDEYAFVRPYLDDPTLVGVQFGVLPEPEAGGDYLMTDGNIVTRTPTLVHIDVETGQQLRSLQLSPRVDGRASHLSSYAVTQVEGSPALVHVDDKDLVIRRPTGEEVPAFVNDEHVVMMDRHHFSVYSRSGGPSLFPTSSARALSIVCDSTGNVFYSTGNGQLRRFDIGTGRSTLLLDARRWSLQAWLVAISGGLLFPIVWLALASRFQSLPPIAEATLMLGVLFAGLITCGLYGVPLFALRQHILVSVVYLVTATLLPLSVVWASNYDSNWRYALPIGTLFYSVALLFSVSASIRNPLPAFVAASAMMLFWQILGHYVLSTMIPSESGGQRRSRIHFSLRQMVATTLGFALVFACLRASVASQDALPSEFAWSTTASLMISLATLAALGFAVYFRNVVVAFASVVLTVALIVAVHALSAIKVGLVSISGSALVDLDRISWYPIAIIAAVTVFALIRYVRRSEFAFHG